MCAVLFIDAYPAGKRVRLSRKQRKEAIKNLSPQYKLFLDMTYYISLDDERDVFLSLTNTRERDIFVRAFWQQRDPTPGTVDNEYYMEIRKRFDYVQKYFSRGTSRQGWQTDMGRFYMILGKPNTIERFDSKPGLYPAHVWYYFGDKSLGLPTYFSVMYYKPNNTTEWKFYNPSVEGPRSLLVQTEMMDDTNYEALYEKIRELAPELAMPALTMIPNEIAPGFRPPLRNNLIVSNIHESPKRKINVSYATHFLDYKGYVHSEASVNYIENSGLITISRYGRFGFDFVTVSIKPKKISLGYSEEKSQYYFSYDLTFSLKKGEKFIFEEKKHFDFYLDEDKVNNLRGNGLVLHHVFPAIPGKYKLTVFAMNSVGKEFTYFDRNVNIPGSSAGPILSTPVIGHKTENQADNFLFAYRIKDQKLFVDPSKNFRIRSKPLVMLGANNLDRKLWQSGKIVLLVKGLSERRKYEKKYELPLKEYTYDKNLNMLKQIGEEGLNPDYYEMSVMLIDGSGKLLDTKQVNFSISPVSNFGYAMESFNKIRADNPFYFFSLLGSQYEKNGNIAAAEDYFNRSIKSNPQFLSGYVPYLRLLNKQKKFTQVLVEVEKLNGNEKLAFDYFLLKGTALYGMKDFQEALNHLVEANKIYDSDTRVLNLLGFTFISLNDRKEALKAFEASLKLDSKQEFIKKIIADVKNRP
jgi:GWxTD domain-containing protein